MLRDTRTAAHPIVVKIIRPQRLELASIKGGRDITRPYFGKMLEPLDSVLAGQGRDYQVYEELLKDSQVHSCFQQLSDRISECETTVLPGGERPIDLAAAEAFELVLKTIGWDEITKRMAYARIFGFSVAEVLWGLGGTIECIKVRSQRRFKFDEDLNLRLLTMTNSYEGELLPCRKFWHLSMGGWRSDEPYGLGLGHQLYWPVYFKKNGVLSWLRFLEKYGHPLPLVRHAEGATDDQKREAIYLAQSLAEDSAAAGSENLTFDLIESSRNGTADYTQLVQTMDAQIAKIILSQGMTTDNGSSRAQADIHNGVADSIVKSMSDLICESFNKSIVTWWTEFNFPGAEPPQVWRRTEPESDLVAIVARDKTLSEMGFPPTAEYIIETYGEGFRPPERGEDAPIALNGAQVTALTTTISQAISDGWIPELAVATIRASFPTIGADLITAIAEQLQAQVDKSAELAKPQEAIVSPDVAAAMFAETLDYAGKKGGKGKKNCEKGKICKGSCIAKAKTCLGDMNPQQLAAHKAAQKAARKAKAGGGGGTPDPAAVPAVPPVVTADAAKPIDKNDIPVADSANDDPKLKEKTDRLGNPKNFSIGRGKNRVEIEADNDHSPTWVQNDSGLIVSGQRSRAFLNMTWTGKKNIYDLTPQEFKSFFEQIRANKAYENVQEFRLGKIREFPNRNPALEAKRQEDLSRLKALEDAGLISVVSQGNKMNDGSINENNLKNIIVNFDDKGQIRKATDAELKTAPARAEAFRLREEQVAQVEAEHTFSVGLSKDDIKAIRKEETSVSKKVQEVEDKLYGRKNTKTATEAEYTARAEKWAESQGFKNDGDGVNGFTAKQAAKHDIAHPATHDLVGLDSDGIHSYFGGLKTASGKKSLLGEEAIVNVMEHLSRGDTLESSVMSGTRVARMLSRDSTPEERAYVRSPKFLQDLNSLAEKSLRADNFGTISKVIRESNWESGTVTQAGNV